MHNIKGLSTRQMRFEHLISGFIDQKYGNTDQFLPKELVEELATNLKNHHLNNLMHPAGIGRAQSFEKNKKFRGDTIKWIDEATNDQAEIKFLHIINEFIAYLNQTCYTGINAFEFHYARYDKGSFYKRHKDQFTSDSGRKFSLVIYLNPTWEDKWGGQLKMYLQDGDQIIQPIGGKAIFFSADEIEHEVLKASNKRYSITGWLKKV